MLNMVFRDCGSDMLEIILGFQDHWNEVIRNYHAIAVIFFEFFQ